MKKPSLTDRLERYLKLTGELVCGGELQKLAADAGFEPQNAGRRLRELVNENILEVQYIKGRNKIPVAWYRYKSIISSYEAEARQEQLFV